MYSSLSGEGQIRLLKVELDANGTQVQCELKTFCLKDDPEYIAISYTWGPPTTQHEATNTSSGTVRCNGYNIEVTQNLYHLLLRISGDESLQPSWYWVDFLCINQNDNIEKSSQVSLMASIYHSANRVIAWLGEEDSHTKEAIELIEKLAMLHPDCLRHVRPKNMDSATFRRILGPLSHQRAWNSLGHFWRRTYFSRTWIIQEIALANEVTAMCGGHSIRWAHITMASLFFTVTPWARFKDDSALLYALVKSRQFLSSDPRDKIYALLGLYSDYAKGKARLLPKYDNFSCIDAYISSAIQILEDTDHLLLLAYSEGEDFHNLKGLPSWVPDWSCPKALGLGIVGYRRFQATRQQPRVLKIDESIKSLTLRGLRLDTVVEVGEAKEEPRWEAFWRTLVTDTAARVNGVAQNDTDPPAYIHKVDHPAPNDYGFAFRSWLTHVIDRWKHEPQTGKKEHFLTEIARIAAAAETDLASKLGMSADNGHEPPSADDFETTMNHSSQTRLIRTRMNYIGITTTSVRQNDSVWLVLGSRVPLVFREGPDERFRLVGGACIHGVMQGEAMREDCLEDIVVI
ncbi:heterokaryon incompatibility protein-domain-containing protein [Stachybotrys elegans]|uniref:Heterokaryon incompatibility protein-domain-containing protein n=1 Tax=Stachybotrys elegans TaxID=80388 RepID=A0A8K0SH90_9HYPO|nr:heterokaryon incompatibility protein-domain-containing protein [Stachybotrys elegans]